MTSCSAPSLPPPIWQPDVRPEANTVQSESLKLDADQIDPMYTELIPVDLSTVISVAAARNFDILQARQAVEISHGKYEAAVGSAFPVIVPTTLFSSVEGTVRATEGDLVGVGFDTFEANVALQWIVNPGKVYYDIVAAKKRLAAQELQEQAVKQNTIAQAAIQFYSLVLAQTGIEAARQGVLEANELLRINQLRQNAGTGVPVDVLRATAQLAGRQQELVSSMNRFYNASVELSLTLRLAPMTTLVPNLSELPPVQLVRDDLPIDEMLEIAVALRPDLASIRKLVEAAGADDERTWWSNFGPQLALSYQYGGISGSADNVVAPTGIPSNLIVNPSSSNGSFNSNPLVNGFTRESARQSSLFFDGRSDNSFGFKDQQRTQAGASWNLGVSAIGELRSSKAISGSAALEADRTLDRVRAQVVKASQASAATAKLIGFAHKQVDAAQEALRLSEAQLQAGTMTTLDVLQAQDAATQARLRYAQAVISYNQAQIGLLASMGLVDETSVAPKAID